MDKGDYLNRYAEGWTEGEVNIIVDSLDNSYQLDDPNSGMISKAAFPEYLAGFKSQVDAIRGQSSSAFLEVSEVITQEDQGVLTAWVWWAVPGTPIQGNGLIKVGDRGVVSERLAFYTKLPEG